MLYQIRFGFFLFVNVLVSCSSETGSKHVTQKTPATLPIENVTSPSIVPTDGLFIPVGDLNKDGQVDTFRFFGENPDLGKQDSGYYKIEFRMGQRDPFVYTATDDEALFVPFNWRSNGSWVKKISVLPGQELLLLNTYAFASEPGRLVAFHVKQGKLEKVYGEMFELKEVKDLDQDGSLELAGLQDYGEGMDTVSIFWYNSETSVLKARMVNDKIKMERNVKLTKAYLTSLHLPLSTKGKPICYRPHKDSAVRLISEQEFQVLYKKHYQNE